VFAKAVNSTAIFVNWTEPTEINGHLVQYQVRVEIRPFTFILLLPRVPKMISIDFLYTLHVSLLMGKQTGVEN